MLPIAENTLYILLFITGFIYGWIIIYLEYRNSKKNKHILERPKTLLQYDRSGIILILALILCFIFHGYEIGKINIIFWAKILLQICGLILFIYAILWSGWALKTMGDYFTVRILIQKNHRIIKTGPYALSRHPLYLSVILLSFSLILLFPNIFFIIYFIGITIFEIYRAKKEEELFIRYYGDEYRNYQNKVPMIFPIPK